MHPFRPTAPANPPQPRWALQGILVLLRSLLYLGQWSWWKHCLTWICPLPGLVVYKLQRLGGMPKDAQTYPASVFRGVEDSGLRGVVAVAWVLGTYEFLYGRLVYPTLVVQFAGSKDPQFLSGFIGAVSGILVTGVVCGLYLRKES